MDQAQKRMHREDNLQAAEAELAQAERELEHAERDIEQAERDISEAIEQEKRSHEFEVIVLYNGVKKPFEVRRDELVKMLLNEAIRTFGPINNPHLLGLFTKSGVELTDDQIIEAAGVKPHEELLLRPSSVRGG
jgi:hypothetical protein